MSAWLQTGDREVVPNNFASQYISIILIIFTCIVWAFFSNSINSENKQKGSNSINRGKEEVVYKKAKIVMEEELSTLPFAQILDESNESINNEAGEALASFLSNHDVNAEFELSIADDDFERAFSISKLIDEYFSKKSLALGAVKVFVRKDESREGLELHLKKARPYLNPGGI